MCNCHPDIIAMLSLPSVPGPDRLGACETTRQSMIMRGHQRSPKYAKSMNELSHAQAPTPTRHEAKALGCSSKQPASGCVIAGDIHNGGVADRRKQAGDSHSPLAGAEACSWLSLPREHELRARPTDQGIAAPCVLVFRLPT